MRTGRRQFLQATSAALTSAGLSIVSNPARAANVRLIEADPEAGFNYPYYLYVPQPESIRSDASIIVQPNDTPGGTTDDFEKHLDGARQTMHGFPQIIADELGVPALVPVFPRPDSTPVDWTHYTHQLDRDTLMINDGPLERIDLQLLAMVDHAIDQIEAETDASIREEIMLNGFSSSGHFVDRFTVLHAERVLSVTAGGLNGMALLPLAEAEGHELRYHIGIADVDSITGESVDLPSLSETNQFLYMGAKDTNDTLPYDDAWTSDALRETAYQVYGDDMITERFPFCQAAYERAGVEAQFRIYEYLGHEYASEPEIVEFHRRSLAGDDVSMYGHDLAAGPTGTVDVGGLDVLEVLYERMAPLVATGIGLLFLYRYFRGKSNE